MIGQKRASFRRNKDLLHLKVIFIIMIFSSAAQMKKKSILHTH